MFPTMGRDFLGARSIQNCRNASCVLGATISALGNKGNAKCSKASDPFPGTPSSDPERLTGPLRHEKTLVNNDASSLKKKAETKNNVSQGARFCDKEPLGVPRGVSSIHYANPLPGKSCSSSKEAPSSWLPINTNIELGVSPVVHAKRLRGGGVQHSASGEAWAALPCLFPRVANCFFVSSSSHANSQWCKG